MTFHKINTIQTETKQIVNEQRIIKDPQHLLSVIIYDQSFNLKESNLKVLGTKIPSGHLPLENNLNPAV